MKQIVKKNIHFELYPKDAPNKMTWNEAMDYCKSLGKGWRLPTMSEMFYIYENKFITEKMYWSNAEYSASFAWYFYFYGGGVADYNLKYYPNYVRAVKDIK